MRFLTLQGDWLSWKPVRKQTVSHISLTWGTPCALWTGPQLQPWPGWASCPGLCHVPTCLPWPWAQMAGWVYWLGLGAGWLPHLHLMMAGLPMGPICHHCPDVHACHWEGDSSVSSVAALSSRLFGNSVALDCSCHRAQVKPPIHFFFFSNGD